MKIGTIKGRHPLPVDEYLVEREVAPGEDAYNACFEAACELSKKIGACNFVDLYYTGLTEATIGAIDGFAVMKVNVYLYRFDAAAQAYVALPRGQGIPGWDWDSWCGKPRTVPSYACDVCGGVG